MSRGEGGSHNYMGKNNAQIIIINVNVVTGLLELVQLEKGSEGGETRRSEDKKGTITEQDNRKQR